LYNQVHYSANKSECFQSLEKTIVLIQAAFQSTI